MNDINSFTFYRDYFYLIDTLPSEDKMLILVSIIDYVFKDTLPKLDGHNLAVFNTLKHQIDKSKRKSNNAKKGKSNENQIEIKLKSNENQIEIKQGNKTSVLYFMFYVLDFKFKDTIKDLLKEYLDLRIKNKYTMTETVIRRLTKKLTDYSKTDEDMIEIITNAINGAWKDFYPLKKHKTETKPDWYGKNIAEELASNEDIGQLEKILNGKR